MDNSLNGSEGSNRALPGGKCWHKDYTGCLLTLPSCCACEDERPEQHLNPFRVDGEGSAPTGEKRWANYCGPCARFWDCQLTLEFVNPMRSRISEFPRPPPVVFGEMQQEQEPLPAQQTTRASLRRGRRARGFRGGRGLAASTPQRRDTVAAAEAAAEAPAVQAAEAEEPGLIPGLSTAGLSDSGATRSGQDSHSESLSQPWLLNHTPIRRTWADLLQAPNGPRGSSRPPIRAVTRGLHFGYHQLATPPSRARSLQADPPQPTTPSTSPEHLHFGSLPFASPSLRQEVYQQSPIPSRVLQVDQQLPTPPPPSRFPLFRRPIPSDHTHVNPWGPAAATSARPKQRTAPALDLAQLAEDASVLLELFSRTYPEQGDNHEKLIETALSHVQRIHQVISPAQPQRRTIDGGDCIICCAASAEVVLIPCNHLVLCSDCADKMEIKHRYEAGIRTAVCPICRSLIMDRMKIFRG